MTADAVAWHLSANLYPPQPVELVPYVLDALELVAAGNDDARLTITGPGGTVTRTAAELLDDLRLEP